MKLHKTMKVYGTMHDYWLFQSAMAHLLITIWLQLRVTIARNEVTNITITAERDEFVEIVFTLDFIHGVSDGWTVVMTTNPKLERIKVCMARFYMYFIFPIDSRISF